VLATFNFILLKLYFAGENSICINFKTLYSQCSFLYIISSTLLPPPSTWMPLCYTPPPHHDIAVHNVLYVCNNIILNRKLCVRDVELHSIIICTKEPKITCNVFVLYRRNFILKLNNNSFFIDPSHTFRMHHRHKFYGVDGFSCN
jgi:hypothetical protein